MAKKSDAKRRAKLKARRKKADTQLVQPLTTQSKVAEWFAAQDAEPYIIAELIDENGVPLAHVEGNHDDSWTVMVGGEPTAGSNDTLIALGMFLRAAVDDRAAGNESYMQFSAWLIAEIEARCEEEKLGWEDFLRSLLPTDKRQLAFPQQHAI